MKKDWYIYRDKQQIGPFSWAELLEKVRSGELKQTEYVWNENYSDWKLASQVEGLFEEAQERNVKKAKKTKQQGSGKSRIVVKAIVLVVLVVAFVYGGSRLVGTVGDVVSNLPFIGGNSSSTTTSGNQGEYREGVLFHQGAYDMRSSKEYIDTFGVYYGEINYVAIVNMDTIPSNILADATKAAVQELYNKNTVAEMHLEASGYLHVYIREGNSRDTKARFELSLEDNFHQDETEYLDGLFALREVIVYEENNQLKVTGFQEMQYRAADGDMAILRLEFFGVKE